MPDIKCPYPGLASYTEEEARFFFGRERETQQILDQLDTTRLTLLYGESGVGKSSVLRAGVMARLRGPDEGAAGPERVAVYFKDWQGDAIALLTAAVDEAVATARPGSESPAAVAVTSFADYLQSVARRHEIELIVVLDQLEEYFVYHGDEEVEDGSLAGQLLEAIRRPALPVRFLAALRDDTLSRLDRFRPLIPDLEVGSLRLRPLEGDAAREAIVQPVRMYDSLKPEERRYGGIEIEPALVDKVIDQVRRGRLSMDESGQGRSADLGGCEAVFLQLVMTRLWRREIETASRTLWAKTLDELGGAAAIVHRHLEETLAALSAEERETCALMFPHLVTPTGAKVACSVEELAEHARTTPESLEKLLDRLAGDEMGILTPATPGGADAPSYEIRHDALGAALLQWRRRYRRHTAILGYEAEAARWGVKLEEERQRGRQLRWLVSALVVMVVASLGATLFAAWQVQEARRATEAAGGAGAAEIRELRSAAEERDQARAESQRLADELSAAVANEHRLRERIESYERLLEDSQSTLRSLEPQGGAARQDLRQLEANMQAAIDEAETLREQLNEADARYREFQDLEETPGSGASAGKPNLAEAIRKLEKERNELREELEDEKRLRTALADQTVGLARWNDILGRTVSELRKYLEENADGVFVELAERRLDAFDGMALVLMALEGLGGADAVDGVQSIDLRGEAFYPRLQQSVAVRFFFELPDRLYLQLHTVPDPIVLVAVGDQSFRQMNGEARKLLPVEKRLLSVFRENPFSALQRRQEEDLLVGSVEMREVDGATVAWVAYEARGEMFGLGVDPGSGEVKGLSFLRRGEEGRRDEISQVYSKRGTVEGVEVAYSVVFAMNGEIVLDLTVESIRVNDPFDDVPSEVLEQVR